jgi:sugar/nucleoside kinase (ribokinase family)
VSDKKAVTDKKFDVLVVGELNVDLILNELEGFPVVGKEILAQRMLLTLGSSSAIFASNLSVLGSRVAFCGRVGRDSFGDKIVFDLQAKGVDVHHIIRSDATGTGITVALNVSEDRAMVTYPGAMNELKAEEVTDAMLAEASHLHVSSIFLQPGLKPGLLSLFKRARQLGLTTSLDPQWDPAEQWECDLENLLPEISVFLPNEEELKHLGKTPSLEECRAVLGNNDRVIVVKRGNAGATLWTGGRSINQPAFLNSAVVDAIGAGDSFNAGFIHRFVQDHTAAVCLEFGALCGAINTTQSGGTTAFNNMEAVRTIASTTFNFQL